MDEVNVTEQTNEYFSEKKGFIVWVKEHKLQLLLAGVSITTLIMTILGFKNKDAINELWDSLKKQIEKGSLYSAKWFEKASLGELQEAREIVQQDYRNPELDMDYRNECCKLLTKFDNVIGERKWQGKEYGYPVHSGNGWHLPSDD